MHPVIEKEVDKRQVTIKQYSVILTMSHLKWHPKVHPNNIEMIEATDILYRGSLRLPFVVRSCNVTIILNKFGSNRPAEPHFFHFRSLKRTFSTFEYGNTDDCHYLGSTLLNWFFSNQYYLFVVFHTPEKICVCKIMRLTQDRVAWVLTSTRNWAFREEKTSLNSWFWRFLTHKIKYYIFKIWKNTKYIIKFGT